LKIKFKKTDNKRQTRIEVFFALVSPIHRDLMPLGLALRCPGGSLLWMAGVV